MKSPSFTRHASPSGSDVHRHQVRHAEEVRDERRLRLLVHLRRRRDLLDVPVGHDRDPVGHRQRLFLVVRHVDERDPELLLDPLQLELQRLAQLCVERAERLVEQQHRRIRARARAPARRAAAGRPTAGPAAVARARQAHRLEHLQHALPDLGALLLPPPQPERDVVEDVEVREERVALEDGVHLPLVRRRRRHVGAVEQDLAAVRPLEAGDQPQRRRLAATGRSEQREELAAVDVQVDAVDRDDVGELLAQRDEIDRPVASCLERCELAHCAASSRC